MKHILFRLLFLVAILFCLGMEVYNNYSIPVCNTEFSSQQEQEDKDNIVFSNADVIEDENINQHEDIHHFIDQLMLIPLSNELSLFKEYSYSNWQPPKLS